MLLDERTTQIKDAPVNEDGRYVLYWMQIFKRASHNHALNFAIRLANKLELPLVVYEGLKYYYPWANDRLHTFILEGVAEKYQAFAKRGIRYVFYLQRNARDPRYVVKRIARAAAALVTDDFPCFIIPQHNARICEQVKIPVYAVDSNGMIPLSRFTKEEYGARTIRPKIHKLLPDYVEKLITPQVRIEATAKLKVDCPATEVTDENLAALVAACDIDHSVKPSHLYRGGEKAAHRRLRHFVEKILPRYDELRNKPQLDGTSRLSPYLHFGFLSIQEIYVAIEDANAPQIAKDRFLEEAIVRRELAFNFTRFNPEYDSLKGLPDWARKTMTKHAEDKRELVSARKIEAAETYDELWNATQRELIYTGEIHNYVRMLWGKLVIAWRPTYKESFDLLVHLNNKYALDGRNPNSYAGIQWCFGKHDRAWGPERKIYGLVRYMTSASMGRKFDCKKYIAWTKETEATESDASAPV